MTQVRVVIHGRVQGVWFRGWTVEEARARRLKGWVRNRRDGTVEAIFDGPDEAVASMLEACREGPPAARVTEVEEVPSDEQLSAGFHQTPTT
jgi:acylphosphatase